MLAQLKKRTLAVITVGCEPPTQATPIQLHYSQLQLIEAAIAAEPHREAVLTRAYLRGWEYYPGQLGQDGLPLPATLPRPVRGR